MAAGIYIHIPFCRQKCLYCDFVSQKSDRATMDAYQKALINEIESTEINETVDSVFFGGGTPSIYPSSYIEEIMSVLVRKYDINLQKSEITIEVNPGTVDLESLLLYKKLGINRISMGLQSANDDELIKLGRIHNFSQFLSSYNMVLKAGFTNINIDIMSAIPSQTFDTYKETLKKVCELNPKHISVYSLIIEEGTPFYEMYGEDKERFYELPDEDVDREMYHFTKAFLEEKGYCKYEISNYAKKGYECRHNLKYWERENYYGFGIAAASLTHNKRYTNTEDRNLYIKENGTPSKVRVIIEELSEEDKIEEFMFLGLRKTSGISSEEFLKCFNKDICEVYGEIIDRLVKEKLVEFDGNILKLTEYGTDISNVVLSRFLF